MPRVIGEENYSEGETPMKLKAPLFSMLLLSAVWVAAQTQNASPSGSTSTQPSGQTAGSQSSTPATAPQTPSTTPQTPGMSPATPGNPEQGSPGAGTPEQNAAPPTTASPDSKNPGATSST